MLQAYLARGRRRVCLLTATPRSRDAWDVYHQMKLFHQDDRTNLPVSPPNLRDFFRAVERDDRELPQLLSHVLIRRTRNHVLRFYGYDAETGTQLDPLHFESYSHGNRRAYVIVDGKRQFFPRRELVTVEYSIESTYQGLYDRIRQHLACTKDRTDGDQNQHLHFTRYRLGDFVRPERQNVEPFDRLRTSAVGLQGLIRVLLFKRLESSVHAFRETIRRMLASYSLALRAVRDGIVPAGDVAQDILREANVVEIDASTLDELRDASERYPIADFDSSRLEVELEHDLVILEAMLAIVEPIMPGCDEKLNVLKRMLSLPPMSEGKCLIFTQFTDTARYLHEQLSREAPIGTVDWIHSGTGDIGSVVGRFAPVSNPESRPTGRFVEIRVLVTTDVLSEGLNLQDADKLINYDLHWNPVRLIQRFGRIDRIGSEHAKVYGFNFFPEAGLERQLGLRQTLRRRIQEIHDTIGEDAAVLEADETLNESAMYAIYEGESARLAEFEDAPVTDAVYLSEAEELMRRLREQDPAEYERIATLPDGIRSARIGGNQGLFVFHRAGRFHWVALLNECGDVITDSVPRILALLRCGREEPTATFSANYFRLLAASQKRFARENQQRAAETHYAQHIGQAQRYVLREMRDLFSKSEDSSVRARIEQLEPVFRASLPQAVLRELSQLRRSGATGQILLRLLITIHHNYGLRDRSPMPAGQREDVQHPQIVCSEALESRIAGPFIDSRTSLGD